MKNKIKIFCLTLLFVPNFVGAFNLPHATPFSGINLWTMECSCSGGLLLNILDLRRNVVMPIVFQSGYSRLNRHYNIFQSGIAVVGSYQNGGQCLIYSGTSCTTYPVIGTVTSKPFPGIGTGFFPVY